MAMAAAVAALLIPALAERFTPSITPTHLPLVNGIGSNAMLLTRTSMPPGLTAASPAYTAPTADQLADEHASWAWIGPTARPGSVPLAFLVSRVAEIAVACQAWPQLSRAFFALRMFNGSVLIYEATGAQNANGVAEYSAPYWLPGIYSEMTAGESHMCFLSTDQHIECKSTMEPFSAPAALMVNRSTETYTQIAAASRFTCGLRALDQFVECFGIIGEDDNSPATVNYTSILRYSAIAAQYDRGFCGIVVDTGELGGPLGCYTVYSDLNPEWTMLPAPTSSSFAYPIWLYMNGNSLPFNQACAMRSDGIPECVTPLSLGNSAPRPMAQATMVSSTSQGTSSDSAQLQRADPSSVWTLNPLVNLFEVMRFIGVDPVQGDDASCAFVSLQSLVEMGNFVPCASLTQAISLIAHPSTWIQLLPGAHRVDSLTLEYSTTTVASTHALSTDELVRMGNGSWTSRLTETAGQTVTIDCTGSLNCFSTMQSNIQFIGLTFTGSSQHAIVSSSDNSTDANLRLSPSSLTLTNCLFDAMGAVLLKQRGAVTIIGCTITNSLQWANTTLGLIELEDASLTMSGTTFAHNHMPVSDTFVRSCLRSVSSLPVTLTISDSHWSNCSASSTGDGAGSVTGRIDGGVSMKVLVNGPFVLSLADSSFSRQIVNCNSCAGGAAAISTGTGAIGVRMQVTFTRCSFDGSRNMLTEDIDPTSETAEDSNNVGGSLCISEASDSPPLAAADVVIDACSFNNSQATMGGCLYLGQLRSLSLSGSSFAECLAVFGGAVTVTSPSGALALIQDEYSLSQLTVTRSVARWAGGLFFDNVRTPINIDQLNVTDTHGIQITGAGAALYFLNCFPRVAITASHFERVSAESGGAIFVESSFGVVISQSTFHNTSANSRGGAISTRFSFVRCEHCEFVDVGLQFQARSNDDLTTINRLGGVIAAIGGTVELYRSSFTRISALPNDLQSSTCATYYDSSAGLSSIGPFDIQKSFLRCDRLDVAALTCAAVLCFLSVLGLGGVVSAEYSQVTIFDAVAQDVSGGLIYARSSPIYLTYGDFANVRAHSGGIAALVACPYVDASYMPRARLISAEVAGGAFVFNECPQIRMQSNALSNITVKQGDGALIWMSMLRRPALEFAENILSAITAPHGAGATIFVSSAPNAFVPLAPIDDPALNNQFINQLNSSLYGPLIATGISSLNSLQSALSVSAGSLLSTPLSPLQITAFDAHHQVIRQDRGLIVQVSCPQVEFRGTTLRKTEATDGSALFSDLRVIAEPGAYTLTFSIVTAPQVSIALNLTVTADCPAASFYSSSDRSCIPCGSDVLVYNATANACQRCPAGWQRVAANDTSGALRDGVSCSICPLGQVSSAGGLCAPCGPNTYQPTPLSECVQCSTVDGLSCVGDGLAQVQSGYFALAVGSGTQQRIQTYQCPETFCSAAEVQVATAPGNSSALASASAVNSFSQCAYPRLASPTNLLCGECTEGYRPWGNRCSRCDSVNGGLLLLVLVLSFGLCFWLLRSALVTSSAGHAVVVLYFVQTVMLELGTINRLLSWLNFTLFSPNSTTECIAPLTPFQQVQAQVLMPVALEVELIIIGLIHFAAFKRWGTVAAAEPTPASGSPLFVRARHATLLFVSWFSVDVYINASLSLMLFSYTQVCAACVNYMQCVDVGGVSVVFNQPAMHCESDDYKKTRGLVIATLVLFVAGLPAGIGLFLATKKQQLVAAYRFIDERIAAEESDAPAPSPNSATARFVARYAPLFAMYSPRTSFWQLFVLSRRICFVAIAVLLVRDAEQKFMAFVLAHVVSQLAQLVAQPFRMRLLNAADFVAHLLLIVISATLSVHPPPDTSADVFVFLLVVPPLVLYPLVVLWQHRREKAAAVLVASDKHAAVELAAWSSSPLSGHSGLDSADLKPRLAPTIAAPAAAATGSGSNPVALDPSDVLVGVSRGASLAMSSPSAAISTPSASPPPLTRTFSVLSGPRRSHPQSSGGAADSLSAPPRGVMARGPSRRQQLAGLLESAQHVPQATESDAEASAQL